MVRHKWNLTAFCIAVMVGLSSCGIPAVKPFSLPDGMNRVETGIIIENKRFTMRWDDLQKCVLLENKQTGQIWSTVPYDFYTQGDSNINLSSPVFINYYLPAEGTEETAKGYDCIESQTVSAERDGGKLKVKFYFSEAEIAVSLLFELMEDCLKVSVPLSEIEESGKGKLIDVSVLPYFCSVSNTADRNSYLFVPSGSGALMYTDENVQEFSRTFSGEVYGGDKASGRLDSPEKQEAVRMPVFGAKSEHDALFGVIGEYAEAAVIMADAGNYRNGYSTVYPKFTVRAHDETEVKRLGYRDANIYADRFNDEAAFSVSYYPLTGDAADYNGMAKVYRELLLQKGALREDGMSHPLYHLSFLGGGTAKAFMLGVPYQKLYVATTFPQVIKMIEELSAKTGSFPHVALYGFGASGLDIGEIGGGFRFPKAFGGSKGLKELEAYCEEKDVPLFTDFELIYYSQSGQGYNTWFDSAKSPALRAAAAYPLQKNTRTPDINGEKIYMLGRGQLAGAMEKLLKFSARQNLSGISFYSLGQTIYSDYHDAAYAAAGSTEKQISELIQAVNTAGHPVCLNAANIYAAGLASSIVNVPLDKGGLTALDETVPFYQMVLRGYVGLYSGPLNTSPDFSKGDALLNAISSGVFPAFSLCYEYSDRLVDSSAGDLYDSVFVNNKNNVIETVLRTAALYGAIGNSEISRYEILEGKVRKTVFENGVSVLVNFGDRDTVIDGVTVKARNYAFITNESSSESGVAGQ